MLPQSVRNCTKILVGCLKLEKTQVFQECTYSDAQFCVLPEHGCIIAVVEESAAVQVYFQRCPGVIVHYFPGTVQETFLEEKKSSASKITETEIRDTNTL